MELQWLNQPLFILGYPKSGTSLLNSIFDNHPQLVVLPEESDFMDLLYIPCKFIEKKEVVKDKDIDVIITILEKTHLRNLKENKIENDIGGNFDYSNFNYECFINSIRKDLKSHQITPSSVFKIIVNSFYQHSSLFYDDVKYWVEKTPYHKIFLYNRKATYKHMFDQNYKVIHIVRDPRDNYISYKKKHPSLTVYQFIIEWKRVVRIINQYKNNKNHLLLRYDDLVQKSDEELIKIYTFLDINFNENFNRPSKYGISWSGNSMFGTRNSKITHLNRLRYIKYKDQKSINTIEYILKKEMIEYNYSPRQLNITNITKVQFQVLKFWTMIKDKVHRSIIKILKIRYTYRLLNF